MSRILVVDDDHDILRLVEKVLGMEGHIVFKASDAVQAMDLLNSTMFDLLISDANMPHFSGFELVRTIRNNKRFKNMAIAMLTGLRERKDIEKAIRAGVDDYIVKPIDPAVLHQKVAELFLKRPPMETAELPLSETNPLSEANCMVPVRLISFSELGLSFKTSFEITEGMDVEVFSDLFKRIHIPPPKMRVMQCKKHAEFHYEIRVAFLGINENFIQKVRAWIYLQAGKRVA